MSSPSGAIPKNKNTRKTSKFVYRSSRKRFNDRRYQRSLKKKIKYTFYGQQSTASDRESFSSSTLLGPPVSPQRKMEKKEGDPSSWFWENYNNAMEWQNRHFVAFWKSRCAALEAENSHLYNCLDEALKKQKSQPVASGDDFHAAKRMGEKAQSSMLMPDLPTPSKQQDQQDMAGSMEDNTGEEMVEEEEEEFVFEVNDEMLAFFETSAKHKIELKKQRDAEQKEEEEAIIESKARQQLQFPKLTMQQRRDEMARLYGPASSMILSMETAMQLSFDHFSDRHHPKPWPNIPLNL